MLHTLANEQVQCFVTNGKWDQLEDDLKPPDDLVNKDILLFRHNRAMHSSDYLVSLECGEDPAHRRLEALEQPSVNIVRVEVCHLDWTVFHVELLSQ